MDMMKTMGHADVIRHLAEAAEALNRAMIATGKANDQELHGMIHEQFFKLIEFTSVVLKHVGKP